MGPHSSLTRSVLFVWVFALSACQTPAGPDIPVQPGTWASAEAAVTVTAKGAHIEFPCASGDIQQPLMVDGNGDFAQNGVYMRGAGPGLVPQAARYTGHVDKDTMTLSVTLSEPSQTIGSFSLTLGAAPSFAKCF